MIRRSPYSVALGCVLILAACAETPMGPTVQVMPGPGKSFSSFQNDQAVCRQFAEQAVRDQAQGANLRGLGTAALTTVLVPGLARRSVEGKVRRSARPEVRLGALGWAQCGRRTFRIRSRHNTTTPLLNACSASATPCQPRAQ